MMMKIKKAREWFGAKKAKAGVPRKPSMKTKTPKLNTLGSIGKI